MPVGSIVLIAGFLIAATAYTPVQRAGFVYEDAVTMAGASHPLPWRDLWRPRAVTAVTYRGQVLAGASPAQFHAVNVALHLTVGLLLYGLALRVGLTPAWAAWSAAMFLVHPMHSQAVAYVSGRAELIAALGIVLALLLAASGPLTGWRMAGVGACLLLAVGGKETGAVGAGIVALYLGIVRRVRVPRGVWVVGVGAGLVVMQSLWGNPYIGATEHSVLRYVATQAGALVAYLGLVAWPAGLSVQHDFERMTPWVALPCLLALIAGSVACWRVRTRWPLVSVAGLWIVVSYLPRVVVRIPEYTHEHQMYTPMLGVCLLTGALGMARAARP